MSESLNQKIYNTNFLNKNYQHSTNDTFSF